MMDVLTFADGGWMVDVPGVSMSRSELSIVCPCTISIGGWD